MQTVGTSPSELTQCQRLTTKSPIPCHIQIVIPAVVSEMRVDSSAQNRTVNFL